MFLRKGCTDHIVKKKDFSPVPLPRADHSTQVLPKRRFKMWLISRNSWLTDPSRAGCIVHIGPLHIFDVVLKSKKFKSDQKLWNVEPEQDLALLQTFLLQLLVASRKKGLKLSCSILELERGHLCLIYMRWKDTSLR